MNLPEEDWICNLCLVYPEKELNNVNCMLCSIQGGAMKLSCVKKSSAFYKKIERLRGNTSTECLTYSNTFRILNDKNNFDLSSKSSDILSSNNQKVEKGKIVISIDNSNLDIGNEYLSRQSTEKSAVKRATSMNIEGDDYNETRQEFINIIENENENYNDNEKDEDFTEETFKLEFGDRDNQIKENNNNSEVLDSKTNGKGKGIKIITKNMKNDKKNRKKQLKSLNPTSRALELYKADLLKKCNEYGWVHVSCALWNPFVQINDFENKEDIKSKN